MRRYFVHLHRTRQLADLVLQLATRRVEGIADGDVRIHIAVPAGKHIDITRDPAMTGRHEDVHVTIRDAFDAAGRQLQDQVRNLSGEIKAHESPPHGVIASLVPERDHGFIAASDGRGIYFHRNSVTGGKFDDLKVGQEVRFSEGVGDKGPHATSVRAIGKHHLP